MEFEAFMWEAHYSSYNVWKATISVLFQGEENGLNLSRLWRWLSLMGAGCWHGERRRDTQLPETQATAQDPQPFTRGGYCWYRGGYSGRGVLGPPGREPSRALWPPLPTQGCRCLIQGTYHLPEAAGRSISWPQLGSQLLYIAGAAFST